LAVPKFTSSVEAEQEISTVSSSFSIILDFTVIKYFLVSSLEYQVICCINLYCSISSNEAVFSSTFVFKMFLSVSFKI
jgi:hypothetical protein